ncbi:MAG: hypothetical protein JWQ29_2787 [Phenylobacterium sp.]|nr:hypothetical protein [Phenylobacterium sp.]
MADAHLAIQPPHLLHPRLIAPGAALLIGAFATDLIYWRTLLFQWNNFSIWLLAAGLVFAAFAGLALLLDVARRRIGAMAWGRFASFTVVALLSLLNAFVHSRDAYSAVVPNGLELSAAVTAILLVLGWRGWSLSAVRRSNTTQPAGGHP